jgi:pimeloyl-ACP methyl ester carboxylesterase
MTRYLQSKNHGSGVAGLRVQWFPRMSIVKRLLWVIAFLIATPAHATPVPIGAVRLYLHGFNSTAATWNDVVNGFRCPIVRLGVPVTEVSRCYRYQFGDRIVEGVVWANGDGASISQLRNEIRAAIRQIRKQVNPARLILIGHSRGGLAARSYVQDLDAVPPFRIGLITLGTPHQGTPLGRVGVWAKDHRFGPDQVVKELRFTFSPSVRTLATDSDANGQPVRSTISEQTFALNDRVDRLTRNAMSFGVLYSSGLRLGENVEGDLDALNDVGAQLLAFLTPGSFDSLLHFVLKNIAVIKERPILIDTWSCSGERKQLYPWSCDGDGVVPTISQRLDLVPGFNAGSLPLHAISVANVPHSRETGRVNEIITLVRQVGADLP